MSTEIIVALVAACGVILAAGVGMATAYLTARHTAQQQGKVAQRQVEVKEAEFLEARDKLLWDKAGEFWDQRAADLTNQVALERTSREASVASLVAEVAIVKQNNAELQRQNLECEKNLRDFSERLKKAGEVLTAEVQAAVEAAAEEAVDAAVERSSEAP